MPRWFALVALAMLSTSSACGQDSLTTFCTTQDVGFDIDQVSALEDNWGWSGLADAIMLTYDGLPPAADPNQEPVWRVGEVQVMVMIGQAELDSYADDAELSVQVFDAANLRGATPYTRRQRLVRSSLRWSNYSFSSDPTGAASDFSLYRERDYKMAWWPFDFRQVIPESGMSSLTYGVAVSWPTADTPLVGYSQFDRPCADNWTNYDNADPQHELSGTGWASNGDRFDGDVCNWPMLKVSIERKQVCQP